jgi:hypothetical protein
MKNKFELLIDILLDKTAREDERDDAAIDLREYPNSCVLEALVNVASDPFENIAMIDNCAESIGEICITIHYFDEEFFKKLISFAQNIVFGFIMSHNPEIIKQPLRNELIKKFGRYE